MDSFKWAKDGRMVFYWGIPFQPKDIQSFEILFELGDSWAKDNEFFYFGNRRIENADYGSFEIQKDPARWFAKDLYSVFWKGCLIKGCKSSEVTFGNSFTCIDFSYKYKITQNVSNEDGSNCDFFSIEKIPVR
jgi:hypothetical protein